MRKSGACARSRPPLPLAVGHRPSELLLVIGKDVQFHHHHLFLDHHPLLHASLRNLNLNKRVLLQNSVLDHHCC